MSYLLCYQHLYYLKFVANIFLLNPVNIYNFSKSFIPGL